MGNHFQCLCATVLKVAESPSIYIPAINNIQLHNEYNYVHYEFN